MEISTHIDSKHPEDLLGLKAILCCIAQYTCIYEHKLKAPKQDFSHPDIKESSYKIHRIDNLYDTGFRCILCDGANSIGGYNPDFGICLSCPNKGWADRAKLGETASCLTDEGYNEWAEKDNPLGMLDVLTKSLLRYNREIASLKKVGTVIHIKSINTTIYLDELGIKKETLDLLTSNYEKV